MSGYSQSVEGHGRQQETGDPSAIGWHIRPCKTEEVRVSNLSYWERYNAILTAVISCERSAVGSWKIAFYEERFWAEATQFLMGGIEGTVDTHFDG